MNRDEIIKTIAYSYKGRGEDYLFIPAIRLALFSMTDEGGTADLNLRPFLEASQSLGLHVGFAWGTLDADGPVEDGLYYATLMEHVPHKWPNGAPNGSYREVAKASGSSNEYAIMGALASYCGIKNWMPVESII